MMDWVKQWELILLLTSSCWPHLKFHFSWEKTCGHYLLFTSIKTLLILKPSQHSKSPSWSLSRKPVSASSDCLALPNIWESPVLVCACPKLPNCAGEQPTCAKSWILPLNLQSKPSLSSEIACWSDCQMTCSSSNFDTILNWGWTLPPDQVVVKV